MLQEAARQSEKVHLEQAMLEDKLRVTDWEATNEAIEEQVARESYLQWLKDNERRNRAVRSPTASSSTATVTSSSTSEIRSPRPRSHGNISPLASPYRSETTYRNSPTRLSPSRLSPPPSIPGTSKTIHNSPGSSPKQGPYTATVTSGNKEHAFEIMSSQSYVNQLPPEYFGLTQWDDAGILAQVLAASQQEYLDKLKRSHISTSACDSGSEETKSGENIDQAKSPGPEGGDQN
jgi:OTU domain-containing protein 5